MSETPLFPSAKDNETDVKLQEKEGEVEVREEQPGPSQAFSFNEEQLGPSKANKGTSAEGLV